MTDEHAKYPNYISEGFHRFINDIDEKEGGLPYNLFLALDNCYREREKEQE